MSGFRHARTTPVAVCLSTRRRPCWATHSGWGAERGWFLFAAQVHNKTPSKIIAAVFQESRTLWLRQAGGEEGKEPTCGYIPCAAVPNESARQAFLSLLLGSAFPKV